MVGVVSLQHCSIKGHARLICYQMVEGCGGGSAGGFRRHGRDKRVAEVVVTSLLENGVTD